MLLSPDFNNTSALKEHREKLLAKRKQLDILIANVDKTLASSEGRIIMSDKEKFEGFKQKMIDEMKINMVMKYVPNMVMIL